MHTHSHTQAHAPSNTLTAHSWCTTHTATHLCRHTCTCSHALRAHTSSCSHTCVLTCTHIRVLTRTRVCFQPPPTPSCLVCSQAADSTAVGKAESQTQQGRGPHLVPTPGGGRDTISPGGSCKEGPGGCWAGARETGGWGEHPHCLAGTWVLVVGVPEQILIFPGFS